MNDRRDFLRKSALLALASIGTNLVGKEKINTIEEMLVKVGDEGKYTLPSLPYSYNALEPFIDKQTMEIHHTKHHQAYVDKLNKALLEFKTSGVSLEDICRNVSQYNMISIQDKGQQSHLFVVRNNAGGHYNHSLFWQLLKPNTEGKTNVPTGKLSEAINKDFKSFDDFKKEFSEKALKLFGSGWCWLIEQNARPDEPFGRGKLKVITTSNQDNPLMDISAEKGKIIMGLDVWEHAYYLKYQNKRVDYISNWWNVANWEKAQDLFINK